MQAPRGNCDTLDRKSGAVSDEEGPQGDQSKPVSKSKQNGNT